MKKTVAIFINSEKKEFLISLAKAFEEEYKFNTKLILRDYGVKKFVDKFYPNRNQDIVLTDINCSVSDVVSESIIFEEKYKQKISLLMSEDRALGQGYLFNIEKIPDIRRASWPHEKKLNEFIHIFKAHEIALDGCDLVIRLWPDKITTIICKDKGINCFSFVPIKFGSRMFWSDDDYITGSNYINRIQNSKLNISNERSSEYVIFSRGDKVNKEVRFSYSDGISRAIKLIWNENKKWIRGKQKRNSYHYLGWLPSIFRRIIHYNFLKSISLTPNQVSQYKLCFFPLHLEPEVALLNFSPEFNNSMDVISMISKSLPVDTLLVVKEQVQCFGVRSKWYYQQINKIGNVVWADPDTHSWDWIQKSKIIATITGTVGIEAVYMQKPVLSFGSHQIINHLPTVFFVDSYIKVKNAIDQIYSDALTDEAFEKSRLILQESQIESSINFPEIDNELFKNQLNVGIAIRALSHLFSEYPYLREL
jgi:hypothetical protein